MPASITPAGPAEPQADSVGDAATAPPVRSVLPCRARWWGLTGSTLLAVGALGAGVLPRPEALADAPVLRLLRDGAGVPICVGVAAIGAAVWVAAWWSLRPVTAMVRHPQHSARWIGVTAAVWSLPLALAPPLLSRDVYSYAAQGQVAAHGRNPYEYGPAEFSSDWAAPDWAESVSPSWSFSPAPYGPLFVIVARGAAMLGEATGRIEVAVLALRLVTIGAVALLAVYLPRLARHCGVAPGQAQWLAIGCPLLLVHSVSGAHNDVIMLALVVAGLVYLARHRPIPAGLLLGAAVAVKAPALLMLPFAVLLAVALAYRAGASRAACVRRAGAMMAVAGVSLTGFTLAAGFGWGWINALSTPGASVQWTSLPTSWGIAVSWLTDPFVVPGDDNTAVTVARGIGAALLAMLLLAIWARTAWHVLRTRRTANPSDTPATREEAAEPSQPWITRTVVQACGAALLALALLAPAFHPWYFLWPLVLLAASVRHHIGRAALAVTAGALCFLVLPGGYNLARITAPVGVIAVVVGTVVLSIAVVVTLARRSASYQH
ncbi:MAG: polyprenol phosphomannose-dependent alpha 1,6 mannosyltransferase MptB [Mycobacteriales bacterium]